MRIVQLTVLVIYAVLFSATLSFAAFDHTRWNHLLQENVVLLNEGRATAVDYDGMLAQREQLTFYLKSLSEVTEDEFDSWSSAEQLAFLINAYNSWTVELILSKYPDLDSIKDLGSLFQSPWKKSFIPLLGETRSLDDIEHLLIRGSDRYKEPRIHFAVNCASIGCPALRAEAYVGARIDQQLGEVEQLFLSDKSRNRFNEESGLLEISSIFKWYEEDFSKGWTGIDSLRSYLANHQTELGMTDQQVQALKEDKVKIKYLKYDWKLNKN